MVRGLVCHKPHTKVIPSENGMKSSHAKNVRIGPRYVAARVPNYIEQAIHLDSTIQPIVAETHSPSIPA